jgi:eukaryotic-like serine/threonine-protein kinase
MGAPMPNEAMVDRARVRLDTALKGKYRLDRVLGVGGMATVYAATHRNGKEFAVKVLHPELSVVAEIRSRFLREGYLANRVKHPGAVTVLDDDVAEDGSAFLVMELLHGDSVENIWDRHGRRLPPDLIAGIGLQLLEVLAAAHARNVIHRDIKPENLLLLPDGQLKVLDFGIARVRGVAVTHATEPGFTMGTPAFMAPEQALAELGEVDARTDLWAAGATLFTLASGEIVHGYGSSQQILLRAATEPAPPLATVFPGAPPELCTVVDRALAFRKAGRWANAEDMHRALHDASMKLFGLVPSRDRVTQVMRKLEDVPTLPPGAGAPSSQPPLSVPRRAGRNPRKLIGLGMVAAGSGLALALALAWGHRSGSVHNPAAPPATVASANTGLVSPPSPPESPSHLPEGPPTNAAPTIKEVQFDQLPAATATGSVGATRPKTSAMAPQGTAPPAPASTATKGSNCMPPYVFDSNGNKRWKRECL